MNRVFANTAPENRNVSGETGLSYQFPSTMRNLPFQNMVPILGHLDKVIRNIVNRMSIFSIFCHTITSVYIMAEYQLTVIRKC
jgi:hypothetical protein